MQTLIPDNQVREQSSSVQLSSYQSPEKDSKNIHRARIDLRKTQYPILFTISNNSSSWKVWSSKQESKDQRDVIWNDNYISEGQLGKKNLLAQNLNRMKNLFSSNFFPQTWLLPKDSSSFKIVLEGLSQKQYYIAKPESMSQGKGIFLFNSITQLPPNWEESNLVVQKYISKPYLIDGLKFDFRIYVLLRSINPLRIYVYKEGLTRFATVKYEQPSSTNYNNVMMHLTNYAINKKSPQFIFNTSNKDDNIGHKRSYTSVIDHLKSLSIDTQSLQLQIDSLITKTILSSLNPLNQIYKKTRENKQTTSVCFEILGFDVMIDENLKPYLIEVNHTPSFTTDTPLDYNIKKNLLQDTLGIIRVDIAGKREFMNEGRVFAIDRLISDIQLRELQNDQDIYQQKNQGDWRRIFPSDSPHSIQLLKIHDQILGIKPLRLYRINYQSLNKTRISQMKKKQKNSGKYFPYLIQPNESGQIKDNYFDREDYYMSDRQFMKYRVDHSMPVQSLFKTMYKKEKQKEYVVERSAGGRKYSYKNLWMLNKGERIPFHLDKLLKSEEKELEPLRLKKLEIDFLIPQKETEKKISRNNIIKAASKSFHVPTTSAPEPLGVSSPSHSRIVYPTKNILFNFQKNKKDREQQQQDEQQPQNPNPEGLSTNVYHTKYLTVSPTKYQQSVKEQDLVEPMISSPTKMSTLYYETRGFKRITRGKSRERENSFAKPTREVFVNNFNRKFSCEEKRLIIGYD